MTAWRQGTHAGFRALIIVDKVNYTNNCPQCQIERLEKALRKIKDARDYNAEHGHYPLFPEHECFDDWAADVADLALRRIKP